MSLRVWLPLNGNLDNQGLDNVTVTNHGATVDNIGKIGKCYSFGTSSSYLTLSNEPMQSCTTECSLSLWLNIISWNASYATYFQAGLGGAPWTHYVFGVLRNASSTNLCFTISNGSSSSQASYTTPALSLNTWYHLTFVYKTGHCLIYVNGVLHRDYATTIVPNFSGITKTTVGACNSGGYQTNCKLNDVRIYDHALSAKEVKLLSQGLVVHYTLDNSSIQPLDNCYVYPTFDTTASNGGWSHWGQSGSKGSAGQNTDRQYIFRKDQTYSHWVANGEGATGNYLCYQSPAFEGGYRSLCIIAKEENSKPITENILYPAWNSGTGSIPSGKWTSIQNISNGFYLCKVEGFQQTGSNDLVGVYIRPGYKVYLSEGYLENDKTVCSDIFYNTDIVYDSSGYCNNGTAHGDLTMDPSTPRYSISTAFNGTEYITANTLNGEVRTISAWFKTTKNKTTSQFICASSKDNLCISLYNGTIISYFGTSPGVGSKCTLGNEYKENDWNHVVVVYTGVNTRDVYCNGVKLTPTTNDYWSAASGLFISCRNTSGTLPFYGNISDVRIYATALSEDDIKELYHTSASVDNHGNMFAYEYIEN